MADLDLRRLALVRCTLADGNTSVGTGYLVSSDLLLTANHVVPAGVAVAVGDVVAATDAFVSLMSEASAATAAGRKPLKAR